MKKENWAAYVKQAMRAEVGKGEQASWASMDATRISYVAEGKDCAENGLPLELLLSFSKPLLIAALEAGGSDKAEGIWFLAESWLREGYEQAEKERND